MREAVPSSLTLLLVRMSFGGHFSQPVPIATHPLIGHNLPYQPMHGNWHRLAKMATKRHLHEQQCKATGLCLSLLYKI